MSITLRGNRVLAPRQIVMLQHGHDMVDALGIVAVITCYATTPSPWNALATWGTSSRLISAEGLCRPRDHGHEQPLDFVGGVGRQVAADRVQGQPVQQPGRA